MNENTNKLLDLIKENPDLPIIPMVNYEICGYTIEKEVINNMS